MGLSFSFLALYSGTGLPEGFVACIVNGNSRYLLAAFALMVCASRAHAQSAATYPARAIRIVVPFAPGKTLHDIVAKLNTEIVRIITSREMRERLQQEGTEVARDTPEKFTRFFHGEIAKWAKVIRDAGIKLD